MLKLIIPFGGEISESGLGRSAKQHYDPELIDRLRASHFRILKVQGEINAALASGAYEEATGKLLGLRASINGHFELENSRLIAYLRGMQLSGLFSFRREIEFVASSVMSFIDRYIEQGINSANAEEFVRGFDDQIELLVDRFQCAENELYSRYRKH